MQNEKGQFVKGIHPKTEFKKGHITWNKKPKIKKKCLNCGKDIFTIKALQERKKYCSKTCYNISLKGKPTWCKGKKNPQISGNKHWNWKGGQIKDKDGYILIKANSHPFKNGCGYVRRSRLVMEKVIKRHLTPKEIVHHKGTKYPIGSLENKSDDRPENLKLFANKSEHTKFHCKL